MLCTPLSTVLLSKPLPTHVRHPKGTQHYRNCPHTTARQTVECSTVYFNSAFKKNTQPYYAGLGNTSFFCCSKLFWRRVHSQQGKALLTALVWGKQVCKFGSQILGMAICIYKLCGPELLSQVHREPGLGRNIRLCWCPPTVCTQQSDVSPQ